MNTIPTITEEDIRALVGEQSFQRGQQYFHDEAIFDAFQQGMTLKGHCHGSRPTPYRVQVTFDTKGITGAICSCPVGRQMVKGYYCKHVAALLLTWREQPEKFTELDPVETLLERRSKGELIALITYMLQKQPELEWELLMPPPTDHKRKNTVDPETYRRQVDEAFSNGGRAWDAVYGISSDLYAITGIAAAFLRQNDYANAAIIYEVVARETLGYYLSYHDEDGALGRVIKDCVEELGNCLASEQEDEAVRQRIIETIFAVYRFDIDKGGFGLTDDIPPELLQHTTPDEKRLIADWVRTILSEIQGTETSDNWHRKRYGGLLLSLEAEILDDEEFLRIGRETNRVHEVVKRLLERGRVDEAVQDAESVRDWDLVKLAELFLQYGKDAAAERMLQTRSKQTQNKYVPEWLKNYYLARNNYAAALEVAELIFHIQPWLENYQEIRELATQLGRWETLRPELLTFLQTSQQTYTLTEVALDEGEIDKAIELLKAAKVTNQSRGHQWTHNYDSRYYTIAIKVADAAAELYPRAAIEIYRPYIEHLIAQRGRSNYETACSYLAKVRTLYEKLGESEEWTNYIALLRKQNSRLVSFKQELAAAGL